jgi:hydroxypyruvate reductase
MNPRDDLREIYMAAIESVNPSTALKNYLRREDDRLILSGGEGESVFQLTDYNRILVVGAGKATAPMASALEDILGDRISRGAIVVKYGHTHPLRIIELMEGAHPVPDEAGARGTVKLTEILEEAGEDDLVISLISGGGSALMPSPPDPVTLEDKMTTTDLLLKSGAGIHEMNAVRKHLSRTKGGNCARLAYPATVINCMISDVVGDAMDVIASGPFVPDTSTFKDVEKIIRNYGLREKVPDGVIKRIEEGIQGKHHENPRSGDPVFEKVYNRIIASNIIACRAAANRADELGYTPCILSSMIQGDTAAAARFHSEIALEVKTNGHPVTPPGCLISGGETTVVVKGNGKGGRNTEFALHAARYLKGEKGILAASVGTDGNDGPTDAAGALADETTLFKAKEKGLDPEKFAVSNDSYTFFSSLDDLIMTGPTNTNVMDIRIFIML